MTEQWTLAELVAEAATRIAALPAPKNGQVRAVPDDRTIRYYATLGLLDRPDAMRGRTALYGRKHLAQIVAIKRMQTMGRSLAEIQALWPTLDDPTLARMAGVALPVIVGRAPARQEFWKREPKPAPAPPPEEREGEGEGEDEGDRGGKAGRGEREVEPAVRTPVFGLSGATVESVSSPVELRIELAPHLALVLAIADEHISITPADVRAIRAAAAPLLAELAQRRLTTHAGGEP